VGTGRPAAARIPVAAEGPSVLPLQVPHKRRQVRPPVFREAEAAQMDRRGNGKGARPAYTLPARKLRTRATAEVLRLLMRLDGERCRRAPFQQGVPGTRNL